MLYVKKIKGANIFCSHIKDNMRDHELTDQYI